MAPSTNPLRIGVLYEQTQMTDLAGLDILGNCSTATLELIHQVMPAVVSPLLPLSTPMEFLYISSSLSPAWTTPSMYVQPTHTYANAPRDLDIIMVGGPDPMAVAEESLVFLKEAAMWTKVILATCSGGMWLARAGVLNGRRATTNRMMVEAAKGGFPEVEWVDQRWVRSEGCFEGAQIWTAGGAGCGIDMTIEFALETLNRKVVKLACQSLEFSIAGRKQFYEERR